MKRHHIGGHRSTDCVVCATLEPVIKMSRAKGVKLNAIVVHSPSPDWQERIAQAFDVILENAARRRAETDRPPLNVFGEHFHEPDGDRHG
jgi:hypothetical protein